MVNKLSSEDEIRKKAIFDGMSPKGKERILKKGYKNWDPFSQPRDPIDIRVDKNRLTAIEVVRSFLQSIKDKNCSKAYTQGVWEICMGIFQDNDRYKGMYEFSCWYRNFLNKNQSEDNK